MTMTLLEQEQLLDTSVDVLSRVVPRVSRVALVGIRPRVGQEDLATVGSHVGKCVEDVGELIDR